MITDISEWDKFITALVTRYKGKLIYELWNEPEDKNSWTGSVGDMVILTSHMYNIIRSIDPGALIIAPSGSATYMDLYYAAGGVRTVDVVSVHGYPDPRSNDVAETIGGFLSVPMKAVMAKYGLSQKPLWDTEGSWGNTKFEVQSQIRTCKLHSWRETISCTGQTASPACTGMHGTERLGAPSGTGQRARIWLPPPTSRFIPGWSARGWLARVP